MGTAAALRNDIGNLPLELTSFVDRDDELTEAKRRLGSSRLVTWIGVGGVGKTRLAMRVAFNQRAEFDDGVWLVRLDLLQDPALLVPTVAATLGLRQQSANPPLELLVEYLAERRLLLLLDSCEHMLDACAALAIKLLQACPDLQILATSREPLGIHGEAVVSVRPLGTPEANARLSGEASVFDAVTLFAERARDVVPEFRLREDNQAAVAEIVRRLDGLPLAIELAAARLRTLPIDEIARRLSDKHRLLTTRLRGLPARHQTLQASLEWSYELCSPQERLLWARLSVFAGGFELDAAEGVCADDALAADAILDLVAALVDKSIVIRDGSGHRARYRLLETIRGFGWAKLAGPRENEALRRRHRDWFDHLLLEADADWIGPRQVDWVNRIDRDLPNIRSAVGFCLSDPGEEEAGLRMTAALAHCYGIVRGRLGEARHLLDQALKHDGGHRRSRPWALYTASILAMFQGDLAVASRLVEQLRALADELGDASAAELAMQASGGLAFWMGDHRRATAAYEWCLSKLRNDSNLRSVLDVLCGLASSVSSDHEPQAIAYHSKILELTEPRGEVFYRSFALWSLGLAAKREGDSQRAVRLLTQGLLLKREFDEPIGAAWCLEALAGVAGSVGEPRRAATLLGAAQALADAMGIPTATPPYLDAERKVCERQARGALGEEAFELAFEDGMGMSLGDAVNYATNLSAAIVPAPAAPAEPQRQGSAPSVAAVNAAGEQQRPVVRVLIADRHRIVADALRLVLDQSHDLKVVAIATSAADAVRLTAETRPDVVLADYQLPDSTGAELAATLREGQSATRLLLLSSVVSNALLQEAVRAGARGFLLKTQPAEQLVDAVRRAGAGEMLIPAARLAGFLDGSDQDAQLFDLLTRREREVLRLLAAGLDNRQIAARMGIGYVTVRSHLRNLSTKLDAHSKVEILAHSAELGLIVR